MDMNKVPRRVQEQIDERISHYTNLKFVMTEVFRNSGRLLITQVYFHPILDLLITIQYFSYRLAGKTVRKVSSITTSMEPIRKVALAS